MSTWISSLSVWTTHFWMKRKSKGNHTTNIQYMTRRFPIANPIFTFIRRHMMSTRQPVYHHFPSFIAFWLQRESSHSGRRFSDNSSSTRTHIQSGPWWTNKHCHPWGQATSVATTIKKEGGSEERLFLSCMHLYTLRNCNLSATVILQPLPHSMVQIIHTDTWPSRLIWTGKPPPSTANVRYDQRT